MTTDREGMIRFDRGDTLVFCNDGLIDSRPEQGLNYRLLIKQLKETSHADRWWIA
ncbi:MAG: hypothetical protein HXX11_22770 [Desulfuromonadales bacterium]|nr:hypothetical protein [Desulfuromonadales bacterium]